MGADSRGNTSYLGEVYLQSYVSHVDTWVQISYLPIEHGIVGCIYLYLLISPGPFDGVSEYDPDS